ncbi:MAG: 5'-methylthioadenosine phosphorylase [Chlamydiales bacterium]|jgi:5'-methylthioadenosine phosphorylase
MLGIIGGTGLYQLEGLEVLKEHEVTTPYGNPSGTLLQARWGEQTFIFLPRHGKNHELLPHEVNYRANIWALKSLGVTQLIGVSAVGSLREELAPGDFVIPSQYFDFVKGPREKTFFGGGLAAHVSTALPTCSLLSQTIRARAEKLGLTMHTGKTYGCVDGPRLGSKAESHFLRDSANCDLVGMTNVPEVFLAREAQMCYCTIAVVTDYDCWRENPDEHVTVSDVIRRYGESLHKVKGLLKEVLKAGFPAANDSCRGSLKNALMTREETLTEEKKELLNLLRE